MIIGHNYLVAGGPHDDDGSCCAGWDAPSANSINCTNMLYACLCVRSVCSMTCNNPANTQNGNNAHKHCKGQHAGKYAHAVKRRMAHQTPDIGLPDQRHSIDKSAPSLGTIQILPTCCQMTKRSIDFAAAFGPALDPSTEDGEHKAPLIHHSASMIRQAQTSKAGRTIRDTQSQAPRHRVFSVLTSTHGKGSQGIPGPKCMKCSNTPHTGDSPLPAISAQ